MLYVICYMFICLFLHNITSNKSYEFINDKYTNQVVCNKETYIEGSRHYLTKNLVGLAPRFHGCQIQVQSVVQCLTTLTLRWAEMGADNSAWPLRVVSWTQCPADRSLYRSLALCEKIKQQICFFHFILNDLFTFQ